MLSVMCVGRGFYRCCAALLALSACSGEPVIVETAAIAASPPLAWQQVKTLGVQCLVTTNVLGEREQVEGDLCRRVLALAAAGAPIPVAAMGFGDPAIIDPANTILLVHASIQQLGAERVLVFSIRPYRAGGVETDTLFAAPPRAVPLSNAASSSAALDAALAAALSETLPWQSAR
jgi:hypothetical protein